jgi:hypothetical protein
VAAVVPAEYTNDPQWFAVHRIPLELLLKFRIVAA